MYSANKFPPRYLAEARRQVHRAARLPRGRRSATGRRAAQRTGEPPLPPRGLRERDRPAPEREADVPALQRVGRRLRERHQDHCGADRRGRVAERTAADPGFCCRSGVGAVEAVRRPRRCRSTPDRPDDASRRAPRAPRARVRRRRVRRRRAPAARLRRRRDGVRLRPGGDLPPPAGVGRDRADRRVRDAAVDDREDRRADPAQPRRAVSGRSRRRARPSSSRTLREALTERSIELLGRARSSSCRCRARGRRTGFLGADRDGADVRAVRGRLRAADDDRDVHGRRPRARDPAERPAAVERGEDAVIAVASHELRTPAATIFGIARTLRGAAARAERRAAERPAGGALLAVGAAAGARRRAARPRASRPPGSTSTRGSWASASTSKRRRVGRPRSLRRRRGRDEPSWRRCRRGGARPDPVEPRRERAPLREGAGDDPGAGGRALAARLGRGPRRRRAGRARSDAVRPLHPRLGPLGRRRRARPRDRPVVRARPRRPAEYAHAEGGGAMLRLILPVGE